MENPKSQQRAKKRILNKVYERELNSVSKKTVFSKKINLFNAVFHFNIMFQNWIIYVFSTFPLILRAKIAFLVAKMQTNPIKSIES